MRWIKPEKKFKSNALTRSFSQRISSNKANIATFGSSVFRLFYWIQHKLMQQVKVKVKVIVLFSLDKFPLLLTALCCRNENAFCSRTLRINMAKNRQERVSHIFGIVFSNNFSLGSFSSHLRTNSRRSSWLSAATAVAKMLRSLWKMLSHPNSSRLHDNELTKELITIERTWALNNVQQIFSSLSNLVHFPYIFEWIALKWFFCIWIHFPLCINPNHHLIDWQQIIISLW